MTVAVLRLGTRALAASEPKEEPLPPYGRRVDTPPPEDELSQHLQRGGAGLAISFSGGHARRVAEASIEIDRLNYVVPSDRAVVLLLSSGLHSLRVPTSRGLVGRTGGSIDLPPGTVTELEYRFRFPDGRFIPKSVRTRSL